MNTLALNLEMEGYEVVKAKDGTAAFEIFKNHLFHLVILDIMMPGMNGLDLCARIRKENRTVLILFLSARNLGSERVEGLRAGADDYLSKPFHLDELLLRVEILLRRIPGTARSEENDDQFLFDGMKVDFQRYEFINEKGEVFPLTKKEAALLKLLIQNRNKAVSRDEILEKVWGFETFPSARTIDNFLINFRRYVGDASRPKKYFQSVRGVGYMFSDNKSDDKLLK